MNDNFFYPSYHFIIHIISLPLIGLQFLLVFVRSEGIVFIDNDMNDHFFLYPSHHFLVVRNSFFDLIF